jgi:hypothetical protein
LTLTLYACLPSHITRGVPVALHFQSWLHCGETSYIVLIYYFWLTIYVSLSTRTKNQYQLQLNLLRNHFRLIKDSKYTT